MIRNICSSKKISLIQGRNNIWYCGAYLGYGFHEDGIRSGIDVANYNAKISWNKLSLLTIRFIPEL